MPILPAEYCNVICTFAPIFSKYIWCHAQVLRVGAIVTPGKRTVTAVLRIMGLSAEPHFQTYHRVLNGVRELIKVKVNSPIRHSWP